MKLSGTLLAGTAIFGLAFAGSAPVAFGDPPPDNFVAYIIDADDTQAKIPSKIGSEALKASPRQPSPTALQQPDTSGVHKSTSGIHRLDGFSIKQNIISRDR